MMPRYHPETMKIIATKAQRHQGFIFNKTFCVTLCLCVLVANFMAAPHDASRARRRIKMFATENTARQAATKKNGLALKLQITNYKKTQSGRGVWNAF